MRRREFMAAFGGLAAAWSSLARAQQPARNSRIAFLSAADPSFDARRIAEFREGLRNLGYIEGHNLFIEWRFARSNFDQLASIAAELTQSDVQVVVVATAAIAAIVRRLSDSIPNVVTTAGDFEGTSLIGSVRRPGGNVTGVQILSPDLMTKRLELLKEVAPGLKQVGLLEPITSAGIITTRYLDVITAAADALRLQIERVPVREPVEFEPAFADMARAASQGALVIGNPMSFFHREKVVAAAAQSRIPAVYEMREFANAGGLLSYGVDLAKLHRLAAPYVDQILKGAKPGDLPVQQPTRFELVINLKTAQALGLTIPPTLLARADEVIE